MVEAFKISELKALWTEQRILATRLPILVYILPFTGRVDMAGVEPYMYRFDTDAWLGASVFSLCEEYR